MSGLTVTVLSSKQQKKYIYIYIFGQLLETIYRFLAAFHQPFVITLKEVTVIGHQFAKTGDQEGGGDLSPLCSATTSKTVCMTHTHIHSVDS